MIIEVTNGVFWDDEKTEQTAEANQWLQETAIPALELVEPEIDKFMRPFKWTADLTTCKAIKEWEFIHESTSCALNKETIKITQ